jgi:MFS family permease
MMQTAPYPPRFVAWASVWLLALLYTLSFIDRQILVLLVDPIRADLGLSDTQVSLLTGLAFGAIYALAGWPLGRLADQVDRKWVIGAGVAAWGVMTCLCGAARSFPSMFLARMGVGLGEAALTPAAYSMVPDLFPRERRTLAMSVFVFGAKAGAGLALVLGGAVVAMVDRVGVISLPILGVVSSWQIVLFVVGFATLAVLPLLAFLPEPRRHNMNANAGSRFTDVIADMRGRPGAYVGIFLAAPIANMFAYGAWAWQPSFFIRSFGWSQAQTGLTLGSVMLVASVASGFAAAYLSDYLVKRGHLDAPLRLSALALLIAAVTVWGLPMAATAEQALAAATILSASLSVMTPLVPTALQNVLRPGQRAQVSALMLLVTNLLGIGFGPTAIALVSDFATAGADLGLAIAIVGAPASIISAAVMLLSLNAYRNAIARIEERTA